MEKSLKDSAYRGRFAPSPTGELHFGSLVAAVGSYLDARANRGEWILRIEDVDTGRCRPEFETSIMKTLEVYGFQWDGPVLRQSGRTRVYRDVLETLREKSLAYGCSCTRKELSGLPRAADGAHIYPGICREKHLSGEKARAWRLAVPDRTIVFDDAILGRYAQNPAREVGDFVIYRADGLFAYQLAVVADDISQGINHVIRGADLLSSTPRQIWLYECLNQPSPVYGHLPVAINSRGEKLSKQTLAKPVSLRRPQAVLLDVLRFLNLFPEECGSLQDLWNWAIIHWSIGNVPKKHMILCSDLTYQEKKHDC